MTDRPPTLVARGNSSAGRIVFGTPASSDVCPNCGRAADEADITVESPRHRDGVPDVSGEIELATCRSDLCRAQLARLRTPQGDVGPWSAVVAEDRVA